MTNGPTSTFFMPTRLVMGRGALADLGSLTRSLGAVRPLVVTDPVIQVTPFFRSCRTDLQSAFPTLAVFAECAIDARVEQIDELSEMIIKTKIDAVVGIGGGSVICTAKAAALTAVNGGRCDSLKGRTQHEVAPLPTLMVPTTAGSGSEVSQWSLVKSDMRHEKFSVGGPQCFPSIALIDPQTLATLPRPPAALAAVDALSHAVEALFTDQASPVTDALALQAARLLASSMRKSILDGDESARLDNLIGSAMANMACGNARLGLCHALAMPLEAEFALPHGQGMAALLPLVLAFYAKDDPDKLDQLARAFGLDRGKTSSDTLEAAQRFLTTLYQDLGIPATLPSGSVDVQRLDEMAYRAVHSLSRGRAVPPLPHDGDTPIVCPSRRVATIAEGVALLRRAAGVAPEFPS